VCARVGAGVCEKMRIRKMSVINMRLGGAMGNPPPKCLLLWRVAFNTFYTYIFLGPTRNNKLCFAGDARA
jgi:hypothetical protein